MVEEVARRAGDGALGAVLHKELDELEVVVDDREVEAHLAVVRLSDVSRIKEVHLGLGVRGYSWGWGWG